MQNRQNEGIVSPPHLFQVDRMEEPENVWRLGAGLVEINQPAIPDRIGY
jgi:hypothetical protein